MSGRDGELSLRRQRIIGREIIAARHCGLLWKELEWIYGRSRSQLWRYLRKSAQTGSRNKKSKMQH